MHDTMRTTGRGRTSCAGVSLIELAIAILIMGILTGGAIGGMKLYHISRLAASYTDILSVKNATNEFIKRYESLPGDMSAAATRLAGCAGTTKCNGANGNGMIGQASNAPTAQDANIETTLFWYHLQAARLLDLIDFSAQTNDCTWGKSLPKMHAEGGLHIVSVEGTDAGGNARRGIYARWQKTPCVAPDAIISTKDALWLDKKFDDGMGSTGDITGSGPTCLTNTGFYDTNGTDKSCYMIFQIRNGFK